MFPAKKSGDHQLRGIRMKRGAVKIKRKLAEHNALAAEEKQAALTYSDREKQSLYLASGRILKKYRAVNAVRREIGISKNVSYRIHKKTITSSPKKGRLLDWHTEVIERIVEFLKRGDNSACLPGKKDTKKVEGQVGQKLNTYSMTILNLHVKFLSKKSFRHSDCLIQNASMVIAFLKQVIVPKVKEICPDASFVAVSSQGIQDHLGNKPAN